MLEAMVALILFLFPLAYSPGPGNMFFAANGARFGFRATIPANIGYHIATWVVTVLIGLGIMAVFGDHGTAFLILKSAGAAYIFWLAWKLFRAGMVEGNHEAKVATFFDGVVLLILNPKAYLIIALMFSQFLDIQNGVQLGWVLLISTIFTINNLIAFSLWTAVGDRIAGQFRTPQGARRLNMGFGLMLAAVALWVFIA